MRRIEALEKPCTGCGVVKPLEAFPISNRRKDGSVGVRGDCKPCHTAAERETVTRHNADARRLRILAALSHDRSRNMGWAARAACDGKPAEWWFPDWADSSWLSSKQPSDRKTATLARQMEASPAMSICRACPALVDCFAYALRTRQEFGIWAATTPSMRRKMDVSQERLAV